jgi:hypothetical protein
VAANILVANKPQLEYQHVAHAKHFVCSGGSTDSTITAGLWRQNMPFSKSGYVG